MKMNYDSQTGLIPAIVQDSQTKQVLMLAYMNAESLQKTLETKNLTFFSRSRKKLWTKGETSGNFLKLVSYKVDCDQDTLLFQAEPMGPTCHLNTTTCFDSGEEYKTPGSSASESNLDFLSQLGKVIDQRASSNDEKSYVSKLLASGVDRVAQKVGEEAVETVIASKNSDQNDFEGEAADLLFHLMVLLKVKNSSLTKLSAILEKRHKARDQND